MAVSLPRLQVIIDSDDEEARASPLEARIAEMTGAWIDVRRTDQLMRQEQRLCTEFGLGDCVLHPGHRT